MEFSLVTTNHLVDRLWFLDDNDYKTGMNCVAITAHQMDTDVLAFILMSNHVHFVLSSDRKQALQYSYEFKRNYSAYLHRKYGFKEYLRKNEVDVQRVGIEEESLERAIAYVQMNSVAANICLHPSGYPWGTGNAFFKQTAPHGRKIGTMSKRAQKKYLKSNVVLPGHFFVEDGYVQPESFVQVCLVERIFKTPSRFNYFLVNSSKAKKKLESTADLPAFRDQIVLSAITDLCRSLYRKPELNDLSWNQQAEIVKQIKRRFCADIHQIVRVTGISYPDTAKMIDSF